MGEGGFDWISKEAKFVGATSQVHRRAFRLLPFLTYHFHYTSSSTLSKTLDDAENLYHSRSYSIRHLSTVATSANRDLGVHR